MGSVNAVAWSPTGERMLVVFFCIYLYPLSMPFSFFRSFLFIFFFLPSSPSLFFFFWIPDFTVMASVGDDHTVRVWGVEPRPLEYGAQAKSDEDEDEDEMDGEEDGADGEFGEDGMEGEGGSGGTRKRLYSP